MITFADRKLAQLPPCLAPDVPRRRLTTPPPRCYALAAAPDRPDSRAHAKEVFVRRGLLVAALWVLVAAWIRVACAGVTAAPYSLPPAGVATVRTNPMDGAEMVFVPSGEFTMGSSLDQITEQLKRFGLWDLPGSDDMVHCLDEMPKHSVPVPGFWMYRCEVTCAQYQRFLEATGHAAPPDWNDGKPPSGMETHPVTYVSWADAAAYAAWAKVRLPTEAEWEKAARGTDVRLFPWGNDWRPTGCNSLERTSGQQLRSCAEATAWVREHSGERRRTAPVGTSPEDVSPYGCLDMAGNAGEWTASVYEAYPSDQLLIEPHFFMGLRTIRGGSYLSPVMACRVTERDFPATKPELCTDPGLGFRCCVTDAAETAPRVPAASRATAPAGSQPSP